MKKICLRGEYRPFLEGLELLSDDLNMIMDPDGFPVEVSSAPSLDCSVHILCDDARARIDAVDRAAFFRGLSILLARMGNGSFEVTEKRRFRRNGVMFDCSRNAVMNLNTFHFMLRKMAMMGLTWALIYLEDTYTIPDEPYFGYCRGRYTAEEIRELDAYADALGIELVPCIQTLSHLARFLHWEAARPYMDTEKTMMTGVPDTYDLIERMLKSVQSMFRSRRVHIGMDEAVDLGLGRSLETRGYRPRAELMAEHLQKVSGILKKLGLQGMMWSDMHFENAGPGGYYGENKAFSSDIINSVPEAIDLVYWDYYHETASEYDRMLCEHELFRPKTIFAGGIWTWSGLAPDYVKTRDILKPALQQCLAHGIDEVFATAWEDSGGECPFPILLAGLQMYAEFDYTGETEASLFHQRFHECVGADFEAFLRLSELHHPLMMAKPEGGVINLCKPLLYEDPLIPIFERDFAGIHMASFYDNLSESYDADAQTMQPPLSGVFTMYAQIARVLYFKCLWREKAPEAVRNRDYETARQLVGVAEENIQALQRLSRMWRQVWDQMNKPFGYEVIDGRLGWLINRFTSARDKMLSFSLGAIPDIEELSEPKLPFLIRDGVYYENRYWKNIISLSYLQ